MGTREQVLFDLEGLSASNSIVERAEQLSLSTHDSVHTPIGQRVQHFIDGFSRSLLSSPEAAQATLNQHPSSRSEDTSLERRIDKMNKTSLDLNDLANASRIEIGNPFSQEASSGKSGALWSLQATVVFMSLTDLLPGRWRYPIECLREARCSRRRE